MNKNISLFIILLFLSFINVAQNTQTDSIAVQLKEKYIPNWVATYDDALKIAKEQKKPVLIYFTGSDWCGPCIALDRELFHTERFINYADDKLVMLEVDSPRNKDLLEQDKLSENLYLKKKFKVNSFPTLIFVNHRGKKIAEKAGYVMTEYYYPFIQSVVNKS